MIYSIDYEFRQVHQDRVPDPQLHLSRRHRRQPVRGGGRASGGTAEQSGFDTVFVMDHFFQLPGHRDAPTRRCSRRTRCSVHWPARTSTARLGTLVTGVTYRHPSLLAKAVTHARRDQPGRALLGIGAAWFEFEHDALGFHFPPMRRALRVAPRRPADHPVDVHRRAVDGHGTHYSVRDAYNSPRPVRRGRAADPDRRRRANGSPTGSPPSSPTSSTSSPTPRRSRASWRRSRGHLDDVGQCPRLAAHELARQPRDR